MYFKTDIIYFFSGTSFRSIWAVPVGLRPVLKRMELCKTELAMNEGGLFHFSRLCALGLFLRRVRLDCLLVLGFVSFGIRIFKSWLRLKKLVGQINMRARRVQSGREHSSWETG